MVKVLVSAVLTAAAATVCDDCTCNNHPSFHRVYFGPPNNECKCCGVGADGHGDCQNCDNKSLLTATAASKPNIVELAESVKDLSTLVSAVVAGDLVDTLVSAGPFTVFAPTNEAFGALPAGVVDSLMKPENKVNLVDVLTYHVLPVEVKSTQLEPFQSVTTVEGKNVKVYKDSKGVRVSPDGKDFKQVTAADNLASNGVVHIIDGVLLPSLVPTGPNIVELAESVKDLSTLVAAVVAGDLADTLSSPGPFTVFAPTNEGFAALPAGTLDTLMKPESKATLVDILTYHVLPSQVLSTDLGLFQAVTTVEGKPLHVQKWGGQVQVGPSLASKDLKKVTAADNMATNGVVHIIDGVLLPPSGKLSSSTPVPEGKAIIETRSTGGLIQCYDGPESKINSQFTIDQDACYGPNDSQIATFAKDQIVQCSPVGYENYIQLTTFKSSNGKCTGEKKSVLIDKDLCLGGPGDAVFIRCPEVTHASALAPSRRRTAPPLPTAPNIVELAQSVGDLSTLVAAVVAGDLVDTLSSPGPFTVFAPTNVGFALLPYGVLDALLKPGNKATLVDLLTFHVLQGQVLSTDLTASQSFETVEGQKLDVTLSGGVVKVGASLKSSDMRTVTAADNLASNGVVHIINGVLLRDFTVVV